MNAEKAKEVANFIRYLPFVGKVHVRGANKLKDITYDDQVLFYFDTNFLDEDYSVTAEIDGEALMGFVAPPIAPMPTLAPAITVEHKPHLVIERDEDLREARLERPSRNSR